MKKRFASMVLAGLMAAALVVPAAAVDVTIEGSGSQYDAYRLLNLTTSLKTGDAHAAHEGDHTSACYNYAYTLNEKYLSAMTAGLPQDSGTANNDGYNSWDTDKSGTASGEEIIAYLSTLSDDSAEIRTFADAVYGAIKAGSISADGVSSDKAFSGLAQGYYLICESSLAADPDSRSLVMLDTAGQTDITVESKEGVPTLVKKVTEVNDSTGATASQDAADMDIGDNVTFTLTGSMPANIANYAAYQYVFHDTLSTGLTLNSESVVVTIAGQTAQADRDYTLVTSTDDDCSFEVQISDLKAAAQNLGVVLSDASVVTVTYTAKVESTADIGNNGFSNEAFLEFSNDPYDNSSTSETPVDKVKVFTYQLTVNKTDTEGAPLAGAGFKLMKFDSNSSDYVDYDTTSGVKADAKTSFTFTGLDSGKYKLVETDVPAGYNKADDIVFEVQATYPASSDDALLTGLAVLDADGSPFDGFTTSYADGTLVVSIENASGIQLPSTGGAGTYLVYGVGALAAVAGIVLVFSKKKETDKE